MQLYPDTAAPLDLEVQLYLPLILVQVHLEVSYLSRYKFSTCITLPALRFRKDNR
jgi:hypothetical protein